MTLNVETLKTRSLTAIVFAVIMLTGLLYNYWSFLVLFSIIHFGCWLEYQKLIGLVDKDYQGISIFHKYAVMLCGFGFMLLMIEPNMNYLNINFSEIGKWMVIIISIILPIKEIVLSKKNNVKVVAFSFLGLLYISLSWGLMISLRNWGMMYQENNQYLDFGTILPVILIGSIWINDTMAYLVGSLIGKNPLSKISPKKTWEGTIGGAVLCVVIVSSLVYFFVDDSFLILAICISSIAAVFGTLGDLLESKLKRLANVKDSGSFMPGHGGFLDRFDSLLIAIPFVWILIYFLY